ncbi:unnamed protein product, partial [Musa textilis]
EKIQLSGKWCELYAEKVNDSGLCAIARAVFPMTDYSFSLFTDTISHTVVYLSFNCVVLCVKAPNRLICLRRICQINGKPVDECIGSAVRHVLLSQVNLSYH